MDKVLDSTQLVSGIAVLLSFLAGYRYGVRNLDEQTAKSTAQNTTGNERVIFISQIPINFSHCLGEILLLTTISSWLFSSKKAEMYRFTVSEIRQYLIQLTINEIICSITKLVSQQCFLHAN